MQVKKYILAVIWMCCLLCISHHSFAQSTNILSKGDQVPNFTETDKEGRSISLSDFKGKIVLLNFTATWCGPCWKMYAPMQKLQDQYPEDLVIISFHIDDMKEKWEKKAASKGIQFDVISIWDSEHKKEIMNSFDPALFPNFVLLNANGVIIRKWEGNYEKYLNKYVHRAMRKY